MPDNPALDLAFDYVAHTNRHLFLTGKAGTGKTTFLHRVKREVTKELAVVAPTGIAALNAGAQTIHSLFSLPLGFLPPGRDVHAGRRISRKKAEVLRTIDLLIIDEISMVRADVLDAIDAVLRKVRRDARPFGGVQLLLVGDLHQLPPVVTTAERSLVAAHYRTPFFFSAKVWQAAKPVSIPLTHIYRQQDADFIDLLNQVREGRVTGKVIDRLNTRYNPNYQPTPGENVITLTSHNAVTRRINTRKLSRLPGRDRRFTATITGKFPKQLYPNAQELAFRVGAQVMFNRNDAATQRYYNGKIGRITSITGDRITVTCPEEEPIVVTPVVWENTEKTKDPVTGTLKEVVAGTFEQHPLRLAWAITIHKSQGLTFDRVIIDAGSSFDHGQVYVALSRCRTFEGIVLSSRITPSCIRTDHDVAGHSAATEREQLTQEDLRRDRRNFQIVCLEQLFDFRTISRQLNAIAKVLTNPAHRFQGSAPNTFLETIPEVERHLVQVAVQTLSLVYASRDDAESPETNGDLQQRLKAAAGYFHKQLTDGAAARLTGLDLQTDNSSVRSRLSELLRPLQTELHIKKCCFAEIREGFTAAAYTRVRTWARKAFNREAPLPGSPRPTVNKSPVTDVRHPHLYDTLARWRTRMTKELSVPAYTILPNKSLRDVATVLPVTHQALLRVKGFGKVRLAKYGDDILRMVKAYSAEGGHGTNQFGPDRPAGSGAGSVRQTLELLRNGHTVSQIAARRGLTENTVFAQAIHWLRDGTVSLDQLFTPTRLAEIREHTRGGSLEDISRLLHEGQGAFSFGELRAVLTPVKVVA